MIIPSLMALWFSDPVSYTTVAAPLSRVVREIARQTKQPLATLGDIGSQPIIIRANRVPVEELLDRIAEASYGKWFIKDGQRLLTVDEKRLKAATLALLHEKEATLREQIKERADELKAEGSLTDDEVVETVGKLRRDNAFPPNYKTRNPIERLLTEAVSDVGADRLALVEPGTRVLFSTDPTKFEQPLVRRHQREALGGLWPRRLDVERGCAPSSRRSERP